MCLRHAGIEFGTENDTEVAAGYLTWRMREGASLSGGVGGVSRGSRWLLYVPGRDGGRVCGDAGSDRVQAGGDRGVRGVGCDGVGVPGDRGAAGAAEAPTWEPEPGVVYAWEKERV